MSVLFENEVARLMPLIKAMGIDPVLCGGVIFITLFKEIDNRL
jgi:TRAP-type C4-dicarboxylate transport system permease large subunit